MKDQRTRLINTTFILVGADPTGGGPGPWSLDSLNPALSSVPNKLER